MGVGLLAVRLRLGAYQTARSTHVSILVATGIQLAALLGYLEAAF